MPITEIMDIVDMTIRAFSRPPVSLSPTPNYIPGSAELIAFDISSVEEDIASWERTIEHNLNRIVEMSHEIQVCRDDVSRAQGELTKLRERMKLVDRRVAQIGLAEFYGRRRASDSLAGVSRG